MRIPETGEHKTLKQLLVAKLKEWFGASMPEYFSVGHELDVFAVTPDGISIYVEIVWSSSKTHFLQDINMIQQSDADVKVMIGSTEVINNDAFKREFDKVVITQLRSGKTIYSEILDGNKILDDVRHTNSNLKKIFKRLVNEAKAKKSSDEKESIKNIVDSEGIDVEPETILTKPVLRYGRKYLMWKYQRLDVPITKEMGTILAGAFAVLIPLFAHLFYLINNTNYGVDVFRTIIFALLVIPSAILFAVAHIISKRKCTKCNRQLGVSRIKSIKVSEKELYRTDTAIHIRTVYRNTYTCEFCGDVYTRNENEIRKIPLHDGL